MKDSEGRRLDSFQVADRQGVATVTLEAAAPFIIFDGIPAGLGGLRITGALRGTTAFTNVRLNLRLNDDSSAGAYRWQRFYGSNTTATVAAGSSATMAEVGTIPDSTSPANSYALVDIHIPAYDSTIMHKSIAARFYAGWGGGTSQMSGSYGGLWQKTEAVDRIMLFPTSGQFAAGSSLTLSTLPRQRNVTPDTDPSLVIFDGDSLTASATGGGTAYPSHVAVSLVNAMPINVGVGGQSLVDMNADAVTEVDTKFSAAVTSVVCAWGGTNDLTLVTDPDGPAVYGRYVTYCTARQAAGFQVVAFTLTPRTGLSASRQTALDYFNTQLRANWATYADVLLDVGALPELDDATDVTYYADGLHQTDAGPAVIKCGTASVGRSSSEATAVRMQSPGMPRGSLTKIVCVCAIIACLRAWPCGGGRRPSHAARPCGAPRVLRRGRVRTASTSSQARGSCRHQLGERHAERVADAQGVLKPEGASAVLDLSEEGLVLDPGLPGEPRDGAPIGFEGRPDRCRCRGGCSHMWECTCTNQGMQEDASSDSDTCENLQVCWRFPRCVHSLNRQYTDHRG